MMLLTHALLCGLCPPPGGQLLEGRNLTCPIPHDPRVPWTLAYPAAPAPLVMDEGMKESQPFLIFSGLWLLPCMLQVQR